MQERKNLRTENIRTIIFFLFNQFWLFDFPLTHKRLWMEWYTVKKVLNFPVPPPPQSGCNRPNSPWLALIKLFPARESLVSDIPAGDVNIDTFFYSVGACSKTKSVCRLKAGNCWPWTTSLVVRWPWPSSTAHQTPRIRTPETYGHAIKMESWQSINKLK